MTYFRRIKARLARRGQEATILVHAKGADDAFGNPDDTYTKDRVITAVRTYPSSNDEAKGTAGDLHEDIPVFIFPVQEGGEGSAPPTGDDHIIFDGTEYAMQAPTEFDTHVEMRGQRLTD